MSYRRFVGGELELTDEDTQPLPTIQQEAAQVAQGNTASTITSEFLERVLAALRKI